MFKRFLSNMGIIRNGKSNIKGTDENAVPKVTKQAKTQFLSDSEIGFIVTKMRQATYQGSEFETFYMVIQKLQGELEKNSK